MIVTIPILLVYPVVQKYFVGGIMLGYLLHLMHRLRRSMPKRRTLLLWYCRKYLRRGNNLLWIGRWPGLDDNYIWNRGGTVKVVGGSSTTRPSNTGFRFDAGTSVIAGVTDANVTRGR